MAESAGLLAILVLDSEGKMTAYNGPTDRFWPTAVLESLKYSSIWMSVYFTIETGISPRYSFGS